MLSVLHINCTSYVDRRRPSSFGHAAAKLQRFYRRRLTIRGQAASIIQRAWKTFYYRPGGNYYRRVIGKVIAGDYLKIETHC